MARKSSTRLGDVGSGHACHFPPTPSIGASDDVNIDGIPAVRQGDAYAPHALSDMSGPAASTVVVWRLRIGFHQWKACWPSR